MKRGDQARIVRDTGLHKSVVSRYFSGKYVGKENILIIEKSIINCNVAYFDARKTATKQRVRRDDILNGLIQHDKVKIAEKCKCTKSYVDYVLKGKVDQTSKKSLSIIKEAELVAAINIWKTKFCKHKSLI